MEEFSSFGQEQQRSSEQSQNRETVLQISQARRDRAPIPQLENDTTINKSEVIGILSDELTLSSGVKRMLIQEAGREKPLDEEHIALLDFAARELKENTIDRVTGLETARVLRNELTTQLNTHLEAAVDLFDTAPNLRDSVRAVYDQMNEEFQFKLQSNITDILKYADSLDPQERATYIKGKTREEAIFTYLLYRMSSVAVGFSDTRGMKAGNSAMERNKRRDLGPQDALDEVGLKMSGRTRAAVGMVLGSDVYKPMLDATDGTTVKVWQNDTDTQTVGSKFYVDRAMSLVNPNDLHTLNDGNTEYIEYRFRPSAGDEGSLLVMHTAVGPDGKTEPIPQEKIDAARQISVDVSYVQVGEYTDEETQQIKSFFNETFGSRSALEDSKNIPIVLINRVGLLRFDKAIETSTNLDPNRLANIEEPRNMIEQAVQIALLAAEVETDSQKVREERDLLKDAINGNKTAQELLATLWKSLRFPGNAQALSEVLKQEQYADGHAITEEEATAIFNQIQLRQGDQRITT